MFTVCQAKWRYQYGSHLSSTVQKREGNSGGELCLALITQEFVDSALSRLYPPVIRRPNSSHGKLSSKRQSAIKSRLFCHHLAQIMAPQHPSPATECRSSSSALPTCRNLLSSPDNSLCRRTTFSALSELMNLCDCTFLKQPLPSIPIWW